MFADQCLVDDKLIAFILAGIFGLINAEENRCAIVESEHKCPGFGDRPDLVACCLSKVEIGDYYCCTAEEKRKSESSWKSELADNLVEIIGGIVATLFVFSTVVFLCCFFCSCCYLHKTRQRNRFGRNANDLGRSSRTGFSSRNPAIHRGLHVDFFPSSEPLMRNQRQRIFQRAYADIDASLFDPKSFEAPPPYPIAQNCPAFVPELSLPLPPPVDFAFQHKSAADHFLQPSILHKDLYAMQNSLNYKFDQRQINLKCAIKG